MFSRFGIFYYICIVKQTTNKTKTNKTMVQTITLSASEIKNNPSVIAQANEYFKNLAAKCEERTLPNIVMIIAEVGVENIFYVSRDYHGRYEDDDCTFTYWDNLNGKYIYNYWGTNFAAPSFFLYEDNIIHFNDALEAGLVNIDLFTNSKVEMLHNALNNISFKSENIHDVIVKTHPLIKVEEGRKFKGTGYLVEKIINENHHGTRTIAKVLSLEDFQIHYCNYRYVQFVDVENIIDAYKTYAHEVIDSKKTKGNNYVIDTSTGKTYDIIPSFEEFVKRYYNNIDYLVATAPDPEMEEKNRKRAAKRTEQYQDIVEWVKTNTDKTTDKEIKELALRILNKRY